MRLLASVSVLLLLAPSPARGQPAIGTVRRRKRLTAADPRYAAAVAKMGMPIPNAPVRAAGSNRRVTPSSPEKVLQMLKPPMDNYVYSMYAQVLERLRADRELHDLCRAPDVQVLSKVPGRWTPGGMGRLPWSTQARDIRDVSQTAERLYASMVADLCKAPQAVVVEVGSFDGFQAVAAARAGCNVVSFEPSPESFHRIKEMLQDDEYAELAPRISLLEVAAGAAAGRAEFRVSKNPVYGGSDGLRGTPGGGSAGEAEMGFGTDRQSFAKVAVGRVDTLVRKKLQPGDQLAMVKISAQGHELDVLAGMSGLFDGPQRPATLLIELSPVLTALARGGAYPMQQATTALGELETRWGYTLFLLDVVGQWGNTLPEPPLCVPLLLRYLLESTSNSTRELYPWRAAKMRFALLTQVLAVQNTLLDDLNADIGLPARAQAEGGGSAAPPGAVRRRVARLRAPAAPVNGSSVPVLYILGTLIGGVLLGVIATLAVSQAGRRRLGPGD